MADHLAGAAMWPLDDEERLLQATAREFARRELAPGAAERDEAEHFERGLFTRMGELGLTAAPLPPSVGGTGFSYRAWTVAMEEIASVDMAMAVTLSVPILSQLPVVAWGTRGSRPAGSRPWSPESSSAPSP